MTETINRVKLGVRLRETREYCGFSQDDVARALRVSRSAISLMESGERGVDALELSKLADLFQCGVDELVGNKKRDDDPAALKMVARATKELSKEDLNEVIRFAQFLKSRKQGGADGKSGK
jgi:transcriptional regulator with XRE-family HTH domain